MIALKKKDYALSLLKTWSSKLKCPHCDEGLFVDGLSLVCPSGHRFDGSKRGVFVLLKHSQLKVDKLYDASLFQSRRRIMEAGMFRSVYPTLMNYLAKDSFITDMGSGEGCHDAQLKRVDESLNIMGFDLAKEGIRMASDYLKEGVFSIVADLSSMPLKNESVDAILNILSPSNEREMDRILKSDGCVLKLVPRENYLIELRDYLGMANYEPNEPDFTLFECVERIEIKDVFALNQALFTDLINMTPLTHNHKDIAFFPSITLDLELWVLKKKA